MGNAAPDHPHGDEMENLSITPSIEKIDNEFVASHWGSGKTMDDAIKDLSRSMVESLEVLESDADNLGPLMEKHLRLLKLYVHTTSTEQCARLEMK